MAQCGKCGLPLENIDEMGFDPGHYCQPQLAGARQVIIVCLATGEFDVCFDGRFSDRLTFGEMLEQVIGLVHPGLRRPQFAMRTPEEIGELDRKWRE